MKSSSRFMKFIGGRDIFFGLFLLFLIGITILISNYISFILLPFIIIFSTIAPPFILAFIAVSIMNSIVNFLERVRIKRVWVILFIILGISGLLTGLIFLSASAIEVHVKDLATRLSTYIK